jgi:phospholipid/cholesterol/gamma-HCH transport system permease protein
MKSEAPVASNDALALAREGEKLRLRLAGPWTLGTPGLPTVAPVQAEFGQGNLPLVVQFDLSGVTQFDSALISFLLKCHDLCAVTQTRFDFASLPEGPQRLLRLATAVPEAEDMHPPEPETSNLFTRIGRLAMDWGGEAREVFQFVGECTQALARFFLGRARFRWADVWLEIQHCGADALPIVTLISFLVGLILAYVGAVTLRPYGGLIYIANLVGLAMVREMGVMMTGVIMSGRTGASFAAQLGTMKVSEEIAALRTMGLSPIEFLVLPRMIALFLMFPLLTLYADFIGMFGGYVVALSMGLTKAQYVTQLTSFVDLTQFSVGLIKSFVFGLIVAATGCFRGMQCGNSSAAVGLATKRAVVSGITCMIVADAIFAVVFNTIHM